MFADVVFCGHSLTAEQGNVTLNVSTERAGFVGTTTVLDMTLVPGNNTLPMTGTLNQTALVASMDRATGIVNLIITGKEAIYNGQHLTYYVSILRFSQVDRRTDKKSTGKSTCQPELDLANERIEGYRR